MTSKAESEQRTATAQSEGDMGSEAERRFPSLVGSGSSIGSFRISEPKSRLKSKSTKRQLNDHFKDSLRHIEDVRANVIKQAEARARSYLYRRRYFELVCLLLLLVLLICAIVFVFFNASFWKPALKRQNRVNHCATSPCVNGECITVQDSYLCLCGPGFTGCRCDSNVKYCESNPCLNGGTCTDDKDQETFRCECDGYQGDQCENPNVALKKSVEVSSITTEGEALRVTAGQEAREKYFEMSSDSFFMPSQLTDNTAYYSDHRDEDDMRKSALLGNTHNLLTWACVFTQEERNPWAIIDLQEDAEIHQIDVHLRFDVLIVEKIRRKQLPLRASVGFHRPRRLVDPDCPPGRDSTTCKTSSTASSSSSSSSSTTTTAPSTSSASPTSPPPLPATSSPSSSSTFSTTSPSSTSSSAHPLPPYISPADSFPPHDYNTLCRPHDSDGDWAADVLVATVRFRCDPPIVGNVVVVVAPTDDGEKKRLEVCEIRAFGNTVAELLA